MSAYQVLARKWRPKTFADLVGQEHVVKALQNALDKGRLHHAYLLTGTRGVGKTTIARILAKSLNCETPQHGEPCGHCQSCRDIDSGRFVDLLEIDAASNTGIDNIREVLENAQYAPTAGKYKVYIIDEVHMLSKSAFNAMLKTLEEPPEHVKFILATTDPHKVPVTVLSRCLQFVLRNMTPQQVASHLAHVLDSEGIPYQNAALNLLGRAAAGSMRDALSLLDQAIALGSGSVGENDVRQMIGAVDKHYLYTLLNALMEQNGEALITQAQQMAANAVGFDSALSDLALLLQRLALIKTVPAAVAADDPDREALLHLSRYFSDEQIQLYYQCALHGKKDLPLAPDEYAGFVMTLLRMLAFTPFAAKDTPIDSTIEGTQWHSDHTTQRLPENPPHTSGSANDTTPWETAQAVQTESQKDDFTPKKEQLPENADYFQAAEKTNGYVPQPEAPVQTERHHIATSQGSAIHTAPETIAPLPEEAPVIQADCHTAETEHVCPTAASVPTESTEAAPVLPPSDSLHGESPLPESNALWSSEPYASETDNTWQADYPAFEELPPPTADIQADTPIAQPAVSDRDPIPEFTAANWLDIVRCIAPKASAAQMLLNHSSWADYQDGILHLAIVREHTQRTAKKEYFDRIAALLNQLYGFSIRIQSRDWQTGDPETPIMYRNRLLAEARTQAKNNMEADAAVQNIFQHFNAKWLEDTLELLPQAA